MKKTDTMLALHYASDPIKVDAVTYYMRFYFFLAGY